MKSASSLIVKTSLAAVVAGAAVSAHAFSLTLDTTLLEANSTLTFSQDAVDALGLAHTSVSAGGYATSLGTNSAGLPQFNLPVTSLSANISLIPLSLSTTAAKATGSSLSFVNARNNQSVSFSNLAINFNNSTIYGDFTSAAGTTSQLDLFNFSVTKPLTFSLSGGVSITESMGNMYMTTDAIKAFQTGLGLTRAVNAILPAINFGSIDAKVVPWLRSKPLSSIKAVPEPSTYAILGVGLAFAGMLKTRRKQA